jgi:uroporphyrinogen decarboxylase
MKEPMTSRERVLTTLAHREPDRVPIWCGMSDEFRAKARRQLNLEDEGLRVRLGDDCRRVFARYAGPPHALSPGATCRTVFGVERTGMGYGQPTSHPLADASLDQVHAWSWPDPDWMEVSLVREQAMAWDGQYAILGGGWSPFWHDAIDLLGMENLYLKMYDQPELLDALLGHIVDFYSLLLQRHIIHADSGVSKIS